MSGLGSTFRDFIRRVEVGAGSNPRFRGSFRNGRFFPIRSAEGGFEIGVGHKLRDPAEVSRLQREGLSKAEVDQLLDLDIRHAEVTAMNELDLKFGKGTFLSLPEDMREMVTDYAFNIGPGFAHSRSQNLRSGRPGVSGFPKLMHAIVNQDYETAAKEYKRFFKTPSGHRREVADRNKVVFHRYIQPRLLTQQFNKVLDDVTRAVGPPEPTYEVLPRNFGFPPGVVQD